MKRPVLLLRRGRCPRSSLLHDALVLWMYASVHGQTSHGWPLCVIVLTELLVFERTVCLTQNACYSSHYPAVFRCISRSERLARDVILPLSFDLFNILLHKLIELYPIEGLAGVGWGGMVLRETYGHYARKVLGTLREDE